MRGDPWSKGFGKGGLPKGFGKGFGKGGFGKGRRNGGWRRSSPGKWGKIEGEEWGLTKESKELCTSAKEETSNTVDPWGRCQCDPLVTKAYFWIEPCQNFSLSESGVLYPKIKLWSIMWDSNIASWCLLSCLWYFQHFQRDPPLFGVPNHRWNWKW